jgi:hypothetical protein
MTGCLPSPGWPVVLSPPNSLEVGALVNRAEPRLEADRLRQRANRAGNYSNALDHRRPRLDYFALLESNYGKGREGFEQFAWAQQEIRIARAAEALVPEREGFVDQGAPGASTPAIAGNSGRYR